MSTKNFIVCGYTAKGFRNLLSTNLQSLNRLFILNGESDTAKAEFIKRLGKNLIELQYDIEYILSPLNPEAPDGILIPKHGVGVLSGKLIAKADTDTMNGIPFLKPDVNTANTSLHAAQLAAADAPEEFEVLEESFDLGILAAHRQELFHLQKDMQQHLELAYEEFAKGLKVHDEWEKIYIANMDFAKANLLTEKVIDKLFGRIRLNKAGRIRHRFFGGSTPQGPVDYVENITENTAVRYFIKGRPGSGKSTMLKKILVGATERGIDAEVYHCGFDPDSLDMLLFPELSLCIFDSTSPHEYYPSREGDSVIDMYAELINANTDELYKAELEDIIRRYRLHASEGTAQLAEAKRCQEETEQIYMEAADHNKNDRMYDELSQKIMAYLQ